MNAQLNRVLYIGDDDSKLLNVISSIIPHDQLMLASNTKTALAMYALYMPTVIIVDGTSAVAQAALPHLGAFGTTDTPDLMLLMADTVEPQTAKHAIVCQVPTNSSREDILREFERLVTECAALGSPLANLRYSA